MTAIKFSIGLPQILLPAPVRSTQDELSNRLPASAGSSNGPIENGKHMMFSNRVIPRLAIPARQRSSDFRMSPTAMISSIVIAAWRFSITVQATERPCIEVDRGLTELAVRQHHREGAAGKRLRP